MSNKTEPYILSIGTAVPEHCVSQEQLYRFYEDNFSPDRIKRLKLRNILKNSGIETRYSVINDFGTNSTQLFNKANGIPLISSRMKVYQKHAFDLCRKAIDDCFADRTGLDIKNITHIISFSCTGMYAPGIDIEVIEHYDLSLNIERTCINFMGCYAAFNALKSAYHIIRSEPNSQVLLIGVELCSLHYKDSEEDDQLVANALFADGASAVILSNQPVGSKCFSIKNFYSEFETAGKKEMTWDIGDHAFNLRLGSYVPDMILGGINALTNKLMHRSGLNRRDVSFYAIHPGGVKILEACEKALGVTRTDNEHSYKVLSKYGNMSSVTVLFVLKELLSKMNDEDKGKKVLSCAFGPGLTMESMILQIH